jgi:ankyrin repeat protein
MKHRPLEIVDNSPLEIPAYEGNISAVQKLLEDGCNPNTIDCVSGSSPLFQAFISNNTKNSIPIAILLIAYGADVNQPLSRGETVLSMLVRMGNTEKIDFLLKSNFKINIDAPDEQGQTPLMLALQIKNQEKSSEIAKMLIDHNAKLDVADNHGNTALDFAYINNNLELVSLLLEKGANSNKLQHKLPSRDLSIVSKESSNSVAMSSESRVPPPAIISRTEAIASTSDTSNSKFGR